MGNWVKVKISDIGEVVGGATPSTKNEQYYNGDISWITPKDLSDFKGRFISRGERNITQQGLESCSTRLLPKNTILFSSRAPIGYVAIAEKSMCTNQGFKSVIPNEKIDYMFLYYLLKYNKDRIEAMGSGTTFKEVSGSTMRNIEVEIPRSITEQKKIANILDAIDSKIENNQKINANLLEQALTIYRNYFASNKKLNKVKISDVALNITDGVHNTVIDNPNGEYYLLSCKNIKGGALSIGSSERKIDKQTFDKLRRRTKLSKGDVLISSVGTIGELLLLNVEPLDYEFQRSVAIVKPNTELISSEYLYLSLLTLKAELINAAHGAVQQCLFISDIAEFQIIMPDYNDMIKFTEIVAPIFNTITSNENENIRLGALRNALLPKLMSGEIDLFSMDI